MVYFLANRSNLQTRRLHRRIKQRLVTDERFSNVRLQSAGPRNPGSYRVIANADQRQFTQDRGAGASRIEVGFVLHTRSDYEWYWCNWVEPEVPVVLGWHRDETHPDLGPVHLQLDVDGETIERLAVDVIDSHPLDVFSRRLAQLPAVLSAIEWANDRPTGFDDRSLERTGDPA